MRVALNEINFENAKYYFKIAKVTKGYKLCIISKDTLETIISIDSTLSIILHILNSSFNISIDDIMLDCYSDSDNVKEIIGECLK